jgi:hypothetical protein
VGDHHLRAGVDGARDQLPVGRDAGGDLADVVVAGNLKPIRAVVGECSDIEQLVAEFDDLVSVRNVNRPTSVDFSSDG